MGGERTRAAGVQTVGVHHRVSPLHRLAGHAILMVWETPTRWAVATPK
jgi:hypothetical protein